ncbi:DUF3833 domain-containing protein [Rhodobacter sp. Har01]|uniref:DUF3833 domain-containing protein n=1 Tax=Rhodobacter sp. Har01 TaxID=2883999 RepID=UPI001D0876A1|nr:DUF3833 domain-containing protein [Rhodobacter sp. Har01]MCB6179465.1 DUF3833 domain-containing protein [Rhodobacter sp. Har01]
MPTLLAFALGALVVLALAYARTRFAGFTAQRPEDYATGPALDPATHLSGPLAMEGLLYGPTGRVVSRFVASARGTWTGPTGTLTEDFIYDSGARQSRAWSLTLGPDGAITGTAPDIVGTATGRASGSALVMRYRIKLEPQAGGHVLSVTDWMYLLDNGTLMNRSEFRKFGVKVAELVATIRPAPESAAARMAAE